MNTLLEIYAAKQEGYATAHAFDGWKIAYLTYAERFARTTYLERHLKTDEIFMLLEGSATLLIGENAERVPMHKHEAYNVKQGLWHNIQVSKDALVLLVENADTGKENTEYLPYGTGGIEK